MRASLLVVSLSLVGAVPGQASHVVGPGGHAQISDAIAVASPGDVVLVLPGTYNFFTVSMGLTILALTPGTVSIASAGIAGTSAAPPAGQAVHFVGITFPQVHVQGRVTFDTCTIVGPVHFFGAPLMCAMANVHLQSCVVRGVLQTGHNNGTVFASGSEITAIDSTFEGASAVPPFTVGTVAVMLAGSKLRASSSTFLAGTSTTSTAPAAITGFPSSTAFVADSTLTSTLPACPVSSVSGRQARCTMTPPCGLPAGPSLGVHRPQPPQLGAPFVLEFRTGAGVPIGCFAALDLDNVLVPGIEQSVLLSIPGAWFAGGAVADATGLASMSWSIPALSAIQYRTLWFQAVDASNLQALQASPVAGGVIR